MCHSRQMGHLLEMYVGAKGDYWLTTRDGTSTQATSGVGLLGLRQETPVLPLM